MPFIRITPSYRRGFVKPGKIQGSWSFASKWPPIETKMPDGNEFVMDKVTPFNWEGGFAFKCMRGSKRNVWAVRMYLPEGFKLYGKRGNPGDWLVVDGTEKYIMTQKVFKRKFWRNSEDE